MRSGPSSVRAAIGTIGQVQSRSTGISSCARSASKPSTMLPNTDCSRRAGPGSRDGASSCRNELLNSCSRLNGRTLGRRRIDMRPSIRIVAVLAAVSVLGTVWFVAAFAATGGLRSLLTSGVLGGLTIVGWVIALVVGPVATVQLWRFRQSGRRAGIVLFGYGLAYYLLGLLALRSPEAPTRQVFAATTMFGLPLVVLLLPRTRALFATAKSNAAG